MYSYAKLVQWAKDGCKRRELEVEDSYWERFKHVEKHKDMTEHWFVEDTLNLMLACAYHFVKYGADFTLNQAFNKKLTCPPPRFDSSPEKNYCGSTT